MEIRNFIISLLLFSTLLVHCGIDDSEKPGIPIREHSIQSVLWQQNAAEYKALTYQAYHLARLQLDNLLSVNGSGKTKLAVIADIDETVLDNSPFNGKLIELDVDFSRERWLQWGNLSIADTVPGALGFFKYAAKRGVEVFYISNRYTEQKAVTIQNLKKFDFPFANETHVLLREQSSAKESRRNLVRETHKILLLLGDNLSDFSSLFDRQGTAKRNVLVDSLKSAFGSKFIVFPNPMYGDWESKDIYEGRYDWNPKQLDSLRRLNITTYK
jgi:5'-nucleotidase (lipoprotein e(P4) family)